MRTAARAYTCFLKHLITEIPNRFQVLKVNDVASWMEWVNQQGMKLVTELDCKEPFNKIQPGWVDKHMSEGIPFLTKRRRWRKAEVTWSVHHSFFALDRLGMGTNKQFRYITHQERTRYVSFELQKNNKCWAVGQPWSRGKCIPTGGCFSAQSADLHSIWAAYKGRREFRRLGALTVSPEGYIYWLGKWKVAMCQFRDNILIASDADPCDCKELVGLVKSVLEKTWGLPVECACADKQGMCQGTCLGLVIRCMGFCIALGAGGGGLNHIQPAALTDDWSLRLGPSLMSPKHAYKGYPSGNFTGALANGRPWVRTWSGQIVSTLAWLQTTPLSCYGRGTVCGPCTVRCTFAGGSKGGVYGIIPVAEKERCCDSSRPRVAQKECTQGGTKIHILDAKGMCGASGVRGGMELRLAGTRHGTPPELLRRSVCVCVWPPGNGWVVQASSYRIVRAVQEVAGQSPAGRGQGMDWAGAQALAKFLFSCLQGWTLQVDRPNRWCLLAVYFLYCRKAPSRMLFNSFFYFLTAWPGEIC